MPKAKQNFLDKFQAGEFENRRILIADKYKEEEGLELARKHNAILFFVPYREPIAKGTTATLSHLLGPSYAMKTFIGNMEGMNELGGKWEIIVPSKSFDFVITTFEYIKNNNLVNMDTEILLIDASKSWKTTFEKEAERISNGRMKIKGD